MKSLGAPENRTEDAMRPQDARARRHRDRDLRGSTIAGARAVIERAAGRDPSSMEPTTGIGTDSHDVLLSVLSLTDDGIVVSDAAGVVAEINEAGAAMLGWADAASAIGRSVDEVLHRSNPSDPFGRPMTGDELRDGASARPLGIEARFALRAPGTAFGPDLDVPGRRRRRACLTSSAISARSSPPKMPRTSTSAPRTSPWTRSTSPSRTRGASCTRTTGRRRQSGWSREALVGPQRWTTWCPARPRLDAGRSTATAERRCLGLPTIATVLRARDGDLRPVDVLLQPLDLDYAAPAQLLAVVRDATERVESQAKLQRLVQQERARTAELEATLAAIGDAVIVCDVDGNVTLANPPRTRSSPTQGSGPTPICWRVLDDPDDRAPRLGARSARGRSRSCSAMAHRAMARVELPSRSSAHRRERRAARSSSFGTSRRPRGPTDA